MGNMVAVTSTYGRSSETTAVGRPIITSTISHTRIAVDGKTEVTDSWKVQGVRPVEGTPLPVVTLTDEARFLSSDPRLNADAACKDRVWSTAAVVGKLEPITISADATAEGVMKFVSVASDGKLVDEITVTGTNGQGGVIQPSIYVQPATGSGKNITCGSDWASTKELVKLVKVDFKGGGFCKTEPHKLPAED